ncbi:hypothetical protein [Pedobacter sp. UBA5917]|jgi:hypothetical protein|uniref:hypothetical protein n=1 Tax=Pedobacter sp. UBA5917 TaxID=1947061 RepID=UPI0025D0ED50|nr:hypothetical protein [Pedobacter sp. UBA5917]
MNKDRYYNFWLAFVNIRAGEGFKFNDLIDLGADGVNSTYAGAWANIIIKAGDINGAIEIIPQGLKELNFDVVFIDKIENIASLMEYKQINELVVAEVDWLEKSTYVFKISDKLFPYG